MHLNRKLQSVACSGIDIERTSTRRES